MRKFSDYLRSQNDAILFENAAIIMGLYEIEPSSYFEKYLKENYPSLLFSPFWEQLVNGMLESRENIDESILNEAGWLDTMGQKIGQLFPAVAQKLGGFAGNIAQGWRTGQNIAQNRIVQPIARAIQELKTVENIIKGWSTRGWNDPQLPKGLDANAQKQIQQETDALYRALRLAIDQLDDFAMANGPGAHLEKTIQSFVAAQNIAQTQTQGAQTQSNIIPNPQPTAAPTTAPATP